LWVRGFQGFNLGRIKFFRNKRESMSLRSPFSPFAPVEVSAPIVLRFWLGVAGRCLLRIRQRDRPLQLRFPLAFPERW
jgi:hypothetical protein